MRQDYRLCRPHQTSVILRVNAQTGKKSQAFENGPETCFSWLSSCNARSRADLEVVCATKFLISVVNDLDQLVEGATTQNFEPQAFKGPKTSKNNSKSPFPIETVRRAGRKIEKKHEWFSWYAYRIKQSPNSNEYDRSQIPVAPPTPPPPPRILVRVAAAYPQRSGPRKIKKTIRKSCEINDKATTVL